MEQRSSIHRHCGENGADHITTNRYGGFIRSINVVTIDIVRYDGSFGDIDVHILEYVSPVGQVQQYWLMSVLWHTIRLDNRKLES